MKILSIFGTRPSAIKMAPVVEELSNHPDIESFICLSGQHREMLDQVIKLFGIKPNINLDVMKQKQSLAELTSNLMRKISSVLEDISPDMVLVQGDTTTCFVSSLAAFYMKIPVGHIEAGLRTHKAYSPFPEEQNRQLTSRIAALHFAPTEVNQENLLREGIRPESICVTGNTVIDSLLMTLAKIDKGKLNFNMKDDVNHWRSKYSKLILVTGHRRENFGTGLKNICNALREISQKHSDWAIVYPVHMNPNVKETVFACLAALPNIHLIDPVEYAPFLYLMSKCDLILTDSGGIQEEAPSLGKPVLVTRDVTERVEAVKAGTVLTIGTDTTKIIHEVESLLSNNARYSHMASIQNPYGNGKAAKKIVSEIISFFEVTNSTKQ